MSSIPGPIIQFRANTAQVSDQLTRELTAGLRSIKASVDRVFDALQQGARRTGEQLQRESKKAADRVVSDIQRQTAQLRAGIAQGRLGLPEIQAEQRKILRLADEEIAKLRTKAQLTRAELAELKRVTLERERAANALATGSGVGLTAGTQRVVDNVTESFQRLSAAQRDTAQKAVLLGQRLGITIPAAMQRLIVQSNAATVAIRGLFFLGAAGFAIGAIAALIPQISTIISKLRDWHGIQKAQIEAQKELNSNYNETGNRIRQIATDILLIGATELQKAALGAQRAAENFAKAQDRVRFLRLDVQRLEKAAAETVTRAGPGGLLVSERTDAAIRAEKELIETRTALTKAERELTAAGLENAKAALVVAENSATLTTERKRGEEAAKKALEAEKRLNEIQSANILSLQKLAAESKSLQRLREDFSRTAVDLNKIRDIPVVGVPSPEEFSRRQAGLDALTKINDEWLRSTGQTVALIQLEYDRDLKNFQDIARAKGLTAEERARAELQLEQIKNQRLKEEREKGLREIKDAARQLFDAAFAGGRSFADTLRRILQAAILAPFREAFANLVARIFGPLQQRLGGIFSPRTGPGGTPVFNPNAGIGTRSGTVAVPAAQANIAAAQATIANLNTLSILDAKLITIKATSVVLSGQQSASGTALNILSNLTFGGQQQGLFDTIFRSQPGRGPASGAIFPVSGRLAGVLGLGLGISGLIQANRQGGLGGAITGGLSGAATASAISAILGPTSKIGAAIGGPIGLAIGAGIGALIGVFGGGKSKREIFEERIAKALKRQAVTLPEGQDFRFANLSSLSDTFGSTFAETAGGRFVASRPGGVTVVNINAMDAHSFTEFARRNSGAVDGAMSGRARGNSRFLSAARAALEPA